MNLKKFNLFFLIFLFAIKKQPNLWDDLSRTVDINLDNLSPYSKGVKNKNANIPMNHLAAGNGANVANTKNIFNFGSPVKK